MSGSGRERARVGVAIAVYNDERYLEATLAALAAQTLRDFHVVLVDDGSSDGSAALAEGFAARMSIEVVRAQHQGRHRAKQLSWSLIPETAPYLLVLDSDVVLPPEALARMVALLDGQPEVAAVSAQARAFTGRPYGRVQAFWEDLYLRHNRDEAGNARWIVGGSVMLRRAALADVEVREDLGEDNDLSEKLRARWRLLLPPDLVAEHHGVPTSLLGLLRRFDREGVRVCALVRAYPGSRQLGNVARLVPLGLIGAGAVGAVTAQPWLCAGALLGLVGYTGLFVVVSRRVPADVTTRAAAALLFTAGNLAFGLGYAREWLRGREGHLMREPRRAH
jgi:hypothetical protein